MKQVCVFCGAKEGSRPDYRDAAERLGATLARRGLGLVYGAGGVGLMGVVADAALTAGGTVVGVIPKALVDKELAHLKLTAMHIVDTMHQRKALMADLSDAFIALPGGYGTADELFEILTWAQLGMHSKPIVLVNVADYFDPLIAWADRCVAEGFLRQENRDLLRVVDEPEAAVTTVLRFKPPPPPKAWIDEEDR